MVWAGDKARGNKSSKNVRENEHSRVKWKWMTKKRDGWIRLRMIRGLLVCVCIGDVENRDDWSFRTKVADLKQLGRWRRRRRRI